MARVRLCRFNTVLKFGANGLTAIRLGPSWFADRCPPTTVPARNIRLPRNTFPATTRHLHGCRRPAPIQHPWLPSSRLMLSAQSSHPISLSVPKKYLWWRGGVLGGAPLDPPDTWLCRCDGNGYCIDCHLRTLRCTCCKNCFEQPRAKWVKSAWTVIRVLTLRSGEVDTKKAEKAKKVC